MNTPRILPLVSVLAAVAVDAFAADPSVEVLPLAPSVRVEMVHAGAHQHLVDPVPTRVDFKVTVACPGISEPPTNLEVQLPDGTSISLPTIWNFSGVPNVYEAVPQLELERVQKACQLYFADPPEPSTSSTSPLNHGGGLGLISGLQMTGSCGTRAFTVSIDPIEISLHCVHLVDSESGPIHIHERMYPPDDGFAVEVAAGYDDTTANNWLGDGVTLGIGTRVRLSNRWELRLGVEHLETTLDAGAFGPEMIVPDSDAAFASGAPRGEVESELLAVDFTALRYFKRGRQAELYLGAGFGGALIEAEKSFVVPDPLTLSEVKHEITRDLFTLNAALGARIKLREHLFVAPEVSARWYDGGSGVDLGAGVSLGIAFGRRLIEPKSPLTLGSSPPRRPSQDKVSDASHGETLAGESTHGESTHGESTSDAVSTGETTPDETTPGAGRPGG